MKNFHIKLLASMLFIAIGSFITSPGQAQTFPTKPIRLISAFAAGSTVDIVARAISVPMSEVLGQQVVVEDKPGVGGNIAMDLIAKSPRDGYTIGIGSSGALAINPTLMKGVPYDPLRDFAPISLIANVPNILIAGPAANGEELKQIIAYARSNPNKVFFASSGVGSVNHLLGEIMQAKAGIHLVHTPCKGNQDPISDLMAGRVQLMFSGLPPIKSMVQSGRLRAIAVAGKTRLSGLPDTPTMTEAGLPNVEAVAMFSLVAPAGTPSDAIDKINAAVVKALAVPEVRERLTTLGAEPASSSPQQLEKLMKEDLLYWTKITRELNIKLD